MADDIATREGLGLVGDDAGREAAGGHAGEVSPAHAAEMDVADGTAANYAWWQRNGGRWVREYDERKRWQPRYHLQEMMLTDYVMRHAELRGRDAERPLRVLEFGCGVGRHLRTLSQLPGVEVFGYDQSATMVSGMRAWTGQAWVDEHVMIGGPTGRLPYDDGTFDIVYTSEVLVHVRPEDVPAILDELCRVSRSQVLHIEPSSAYRIVPEAHDGCWNHDLVALHAARDRVCETLASGFFSQTPFRVMVDGSQAGYTWSPVMLGLMRRLEHDLLSGLTEIGECRDELRADVRSLRDENGSLRKEIEAMHSDLEQLRAIAAKVEMLESEGGSLRERAAAADVERIAAIAKQMASEHKVADLTTGLDHAQAGLAAANGHSLELQDELAALRAEREELVAERDALATRAAQMESSLTRQVHVTRDTTVHLERLNKQQREAAAQLVREREAIVRRVSAVWKSASEGVES